MARDGAEAARTRTRLATRPCGCAQAPQKRPLAGCSKPADSAGHTRGRPPTPKARRRRRRPRARSGAAALCAHMDWTPSGTQHFRHIHSQKPCLAPPSIGVADSCNKRTLHTVQSYADALIAQGICWKVLDRHKSTRSASLSTVSGSVSPHALEHVGNADGRSSCTAACPGPITPGPSRTKVLHSMDGFLSTFSPPSFLHTCSSDPCLSWCCCLITSLTPSCGRW